MISIQKGSMSLSPQYTKQAWHEVEIHKYLPKKGDLHQGKHGIGNQGDGLIEKVMN